ncbi:unnamed protein product [Fructobacillus fructosus]|uniref:Uncharacterized protein n=1 Tax=Fructobacillus fructosus TaxID=1631 RepID=A0ABM9N1M5_9LACO|nr:unnamed protein product [Fructobacillus fructosus]
MKIRLVSSGLKGMSKEYNNVSFLNKTDDFVEFDYKDDELYASVRVMIGRSKICDVIVEDK